MCSTIAVLLAVAVAAVSSAPVPDARRLRHYAWGNCANKFNAKDFLEYTVASSGGTVGNTADPYGVTVFAEPAILKQLEDECIVRVVTYGRPKRCDTCTNHHVISRRSAPAPDQDRLIRRNFAWGNCAYKNNAKDFLAYTVASSGGRYGNTNDPYGITIYAKLSVLKQLQDECIVRVVTYGPPKKCDTCINHHVISKRSTEEEENVQADYVWGNCAYENNAKDYLEYLVASTGGKVGSTSSVYGVSIFAKPSVLEQLEDECIVRQDSYEDPVDCPVCINHHVISRRSAEEEDNVHADYVWGNCAYENNAKDYLEYLVASTGGKVGSTSSVYGVSIFAKPSVLEQLEDECIVRQDSYEDPADCPVCINHHVISKRSTEEEENVQADYVWGNCAYENNAKDYLEYLVASTGGKVGSTSSVYGVSIFAKPSVLEQLEDECIVRQDSYEDPVDCPVCINHHVISRRSAPAPDQDRLIRRNFAWGNCAYENNAKDFLAYTVASSGGRYGNTNDPYGITIYAKPAVLKQLQDECIVRVVSYEDPVDCPVCVNHHVISRRSAEEEENVQADYVWGNCAYENNAKDYLEYLVASTGGKVGSTSSVYGVSIFAKPSVLEQLEDECIVRQDSYEDPVNCPVCINHHVISRRQVDEQQQEQHAEQQAEQKQAQEQEKEAEQQQQEAEQQQQEAEKQQEQAEQQQQKEQQEQAEKQQHGQQQEQQEEQHQEQQQQAQRQEQHEEQEHKQEQQGQRQQQQEEQQQQQEQHEQQQEKQEQQAQSQEQSEHHEQEEGHQDQQAQHQEEQKQEQQEEQQQQAAQRQEQAHQQQ